MSEFSAEGIGHLGPWDSKNASHSSDVVTDPPGGERRLFQVVLERFPAAREHQCQSGITFQISVSIIFADVPLGKESHVNKLKSQGGRGPHTGGVPTRREIKMPF